MKRIASTFTAVALVATLVGSVQAFDGYGNRGRSHANDHANLAHQAQDRNVIHHNAHHAPQTGYQHAALHRNLNHQASHAQAQHHRAHDNGAYGSVYGNRGGSVYGNQGRSHYGNRNGNYYGNQGGSYYGRRSSAYGGRGYGNHGISVQTPVGSLWLHH